MEWLEIASYFLNETFKQQKLIYEDHTSHRSAWAAKRNIQVSLLLLPTLNVDCAPYKIVIYGTVTLLFIFFSGTVRRLSMGPTEHAGAMNFIGLHRIEIESQDKVKEQEWCCHVGKQSSEKGKSGEEEFSY